MPVPSFELTRLDSNTFEHLANALALRVLGAGHTSFGPGPDGGRDGFFEGTAPYPSRTNNWSGTWYIQSKFLAPHLTKDPHKWLLDRISEEIDAFSQPDSPRVWPDNWIIVTNVDPSGTPQTGSFDKARALIKNARPELSKHFHIWGGRKVLDLLAEYKEITEYYGEFISSGQVLSRLYSQLNESNAQVEQIVRYLLVTQFVEQQYTKLEQAGSTADNRPGIQKLFSDIPFESPLQSFEGMAALALAQSLAQNHRVESAPKGQQWQIWQRDPRRARVWFIKGGPGQGKSTLTQYICQVQRAALILGTNGPQVIPPQLAIAEEIRKVAMLGGHWPLTPRIPMTVDLKEFAFWFGKQPANSARRVLAFFADRLTNHLGEEVKAGTLRRAFGSGRWFFVFDGLDEVPGDVKDAVAEEVTHFIDDTLVGCASDAAIVCTSRPQGYSGQFGRLEAAPVGLISLSKEQALACAKPLLGLDRSPNERDNYIETLRSALESTAIAEIMTTPLQAHIMAVVVRDGGKPPERRWQLFYTFYQVIKKREANRNLPDPKLAALLREGDKLLKTLHNRLGFELHARAETSTGAATSLNRVELRTLVREVVSELQDTDIEETVATLMEATTQRLVLVSTPEAGDYVRFDIRPLQEFFAAEHLYESGEPDVFVERVRAIAGDSHWREVMHFLLSALVENNRKTELAAAVTVLTQIDDGESLHSRAVNRRLARGGIIAARLLQEGVLEQDKRVREIFRICLMPLLGCTDADGFLSGVKAGHSSYWLIDVLLSTMREQSEPESIGAALASVHVLADGDSRTSEAIASLSNVSPSFFFHLCSSLEIGPHDKSLPAWFLATVLRRLLRDDWWSIEERLLRTMFQALSFSRDTIPAAAAINGLDSGSTKLLLALFERSHRQLEQPLRREERYGCLEVVYYKSDQTLRWNKLSKVADRPDLYTGLLKSALAVSKFAHSKNKSTLKTLLDSIGSDPSNAIKLPGPLRSMLSDDFPKVDRLKMRKMELETLTNKEGHYNYRMLSLTGGGTNVEWHLLAKNDPWALVHLVGTSDAAARQFLASVRNASEFFNDLGPSSRDALLHYVAEWGRLFKLGKGVGSQFRELALDAAKDRVKDQYLPFSNSFETFQLDLPREADMLPHLASQVLALAAPRFSGYMLRGHAPEEGAIRKTVSEYIPSIESLHAIHKKNTFPGPVRAAAYALSLLHDRADFSPELKATLKDDLLSFYNKDDSEWYLPAVAFVLTEIIGVEDQVTTDVMGSLLIAASSDYQGRGAINRAIQNWREFATAPVTHLNNPALWK